ASQFSFQAAVPYTVAEPESVFVADIDGDGDLDVVLWDTSEDFIRTMLNDGSGGFFAAGNFGFNSPRELCLADMHGDSDLDIVVASSLSYGVVNVQENNGQGFFSLSTSINLATVCGASPSGPLLVLGTDVTGNQISDIITTRNGSGVPSCIVVIPNSGSGTFETPVISSGPPRLRRFAVADFDADGLRDLAAVSTSTMNVQVLPGTSGGALGSASSYGLGSALTGDLDADGRPEILGTTHSSKVLVVFMNQSTSTILPPYLGTHEDLVLSTWINDSPSSGTSEYIKSATGNDVLNVRLNPSAGGLRPPGRPRQPLRASPAALPGPAGSDGPEPDTSRIQRDSGRSTGGYLDISFLRTLAVSSSPGTHLVRSPSVPSAIALA
ncbi:MAG: VCBS repeat-containing protein, partial [Planctomycetes bacterium]|nr:VCBS repeat-containing protein [Planctomycetota bacterium]